MKKSLGDPETDAMERCPATGEAPSSFMAVALQSLQVCPPFRIYYEKHFAASWERFAADRERMGGGRFLASQEHDPADLMECLLTEVDAEHRGTAMTLASEVWCRECGASGKSEPWKRAVLSCDLAQAATRCETDGSAKQSQPPQLTQF